VVGGKLGRFFVGWNCLGGRGVGRESLWFVVMVYD